MPDFRRGKRASSPLLLPLELIFDILLRIPAEILHSVMRCVCKDWYNMIHDPSFTSSHLLRASTGMVLHHYSHSNSVQYLEITGCEIKVKKEEFPWKTKIVTSCNGLWLLEATIDNKFPYYVANPVTKKLLGLPAPRKYHYFLVVGLGYAASIGAYKVVSVLENTIRDEESLKSFYYPKKCVAVLTLGVDKSWRCIGTDRSSNDHHWQIPVPIKGFIYWITTATRVVRSLDVDTELFHSFDAPKELQMGCYYPMAMGDYLALVTVRGGLKCEIWVAREVKRAGEEWTRLPDINLWSRSYLYEHVYRDCDFELRLAGFLKEAELVFLQHRSQPKVCFVCNTKTGGISTLEIGYYYWQSFPYIPSLVCI